MLAIGCDHGGFRLKNEILSFLKERNIEIMDFGIDQEKPCDYPDIAEKVARAVQSGACTRGILVCGTGIGMSIAANKVRGIRAAVCGDCFSARYTRAHNDANVLCLGQRVVGDGLALEIVDLFLNTPFEGGRHLTRIQKISDIENQI